jgi:hypothetical protein
LDVSSNTVLFNTELILHLVSAGRSEVSDSRAAPAGECRDPRRQRESVPERLAAVIGKKVAQIESTVSSFSRRRPQEAAVSGVVHAMERELSEACPKKNAAPAEGYAEGIWLR